FCILTAFPQKLRGDDGQIVALVAASAVVLHVVQNGTAQLRCREVPAFPNEPRKPGFAKFFFALIASFRNAIAVNQEKIAGRYTDRLMQNRDFRSNARGLDE